MIARALVALIGILFVICVFLLVRLGVNRFLAGNNKETPKPSETPTKEPQIIVPEGYEEIYSKLLLLKEDYPETNDILINLSQYPEKILNLFINNQETLQFVLNYPKHKNDSASSGEILDEEVIAGIPALKQWDGSLQTIAQKK